MNTVVTTHNIEIFKLFYTHKYNKVLKNKLYLYVDRDDSSEFRAIVDNGTIIFDKNDMRSFYGPFYSNELPTFSKIYFINMLMRLNLLDDGFYFTDDDILLTDPHFDIDSSKKIVYATDGLLKFKPNVKYWPALSSWINDNLSMVKPMKICATNFYIPGNLIHIFKPVFFKTFKDFIQLLYKDREVIKMLNEKSSSARKISRTVFFLDAILINSVFEKIDRNNFTRLKFILMIYAPLLHLRNKLEETDSHTIIKYYCSKLKKYPDTQPLLHIGVNKKTGLMQACYNTLNEIPYSMHINEILRDSKTLRKI